MRKAVEVNTELMLAVLCVSIVWSLLLYSRKCFSTVFVVLYVDTSVLSARKSHTLY